MTYRVTLITYDKGAFNAATRCTVYDCTSMRQALEYIEMGDPAIVVNVTIAFTRQPPVFTVPT